MRLEEQAGALMLARLKCVASVPWPVVARTVMGMKQADLYLRMGANWRWGTVQQGSQRVHAGKGATCLG